ncbi:hypothetical protein GCM10023081_23080 [Arthrobacter ginkgonis]|uniref:Uncharacterized protein n=1 Tax=Arthrobacter ginkgonis TaxID=1630594 RepID=A0ABP7CA22_9MICC
MGDYRLYAESEKSTYLAPSCSLCGQHRHVRWEYQETAERQEAAEHQETKGRKEPADHKNAGGHKGHEDKGHEDKASEGAGGWLPRDAGCSNEACADYRA